MTELIHDLAAQLVLKVRALVRNSRMRILQQNHSLASPIAALIRTPRDPALGNSELGLSGAIPTRILDLAAIRKNGKAREAHVDTNAFGACPKRSTQALHAEADIPLSRLPLHRDGLYVPIQPDDAASP